MANTIEISKANPLKFYAQSELIQSSQYALANNGTFNPNFNFKNIDEDCFLNILPSWMAKEGYSKPFQNGDSISIQLIVKNTQYIK